MLQKTVYNAYTVNQGPAIKSKDAQHTKQTTLFGFKPTETKKKPPQGSQSIGNKTSPATSQEAVPAFKSSTGSNLPRDDEPTQVDDEPTQVEETLEPSTLVENGSPTVAEVCDHCKLAKALSHNSSLIRLLQVADNEEIEWAPSPPYIGDAELVADS